MLGSAYKFILPLFFLWWKTLCCRINVWCATTAMRVTFCSTGYTTRDKDTLTPLDQLVTLNKLRPGWGQSNLTTTLQFPLSKKVSSFNRNVTWCCLWNRDTPFQNGWYFERLLTTYGKMSYGWSLFRCWHAGHSHHYNYYLHPPLEILGGTLLWKSPDHK